MFFELMECCIATETQQASAFARVVRMIDSQAANFPAFCDRMRLLFSAKSAFSILSGMKFIISFE